MYSIVKIIMSLITAKTYAKEIPEKCGPVAGRKYVVHLHT